MLIHGTAVALDRCGCLIVGAAGAGKSTLAIEMMALGAELVADDRTEVEAEDEALLLSCPEAIRGLIEVRGVGVLRVTQAGPVRLTLIVDLDAEEPERIPPPRQRDLLGRSVPVIFGRARHGLAAILVQLLRPGVSRLP